MKKTLKLMVIASLVVTLLTGLSMGALAEEIISGPLQLVDETAVPGDEVTGEEVVEEVIVEGEVIENDAIEGEEIEGEIIEDELTEEEIVEGEIIEEEIVEEEIIEDELTEEEIVEEEIVEDELTEEEIVEEEIVEGELTEEEIVEEEIVEGEIVEEEIPEEEIPEEEPVVFTGTVEIYLENTGDLYYGDTLRLIAVVENANIAYTLRWEQNDGNGWQAIEGANTAVYEFVVDEENALYEYRVVLTTVE